MKKVRFLPATIFAALLALLAVCIFALSGCSVNYFSGCSAQNSDNVPLVDPAYRFELEKYDVTYDISDDCSIQVTEIMDVFYRGRFSTGFYRDIPVNAGTQVKNVKASKLDGDSPSFYYDVDIEYAGFITVDIGDSSSKYNKREKYLLTYTYVITNSFVKKGTLPLNPVGTGWESEISSANVTMILPEGFTGAECFYGKKGSADQLAYKQTVEDGRTVLRVENVSLPSFNGISFDLHFENGALKNYFDFTPFIFVIVAAVVFAALIVLKFTLFGKSYITPVVNYEAPNNLDPLMMGKLIDNKIDNEDVTSMIFYWASKGYIKINFENKYKPILIRIAKELPSGCSNYERTLYTGLFVEGDAVSINSLANKYYKWIDRAKSEINTKTKGQLYKSWTNWASLAIAVVAGLFMGVVPLILAFSQISSTFLYFAGFTAVVPAVLINLCSQTVLTLKYKKKPLTFRLMWVAVAVFCCIVAAAYLLIPSAIIGIWAKLLLALAGMGIAATSSLLVSRTDKYTQQLGEILGFKEFIKLAEKDQLEKMLEDNPQFYYNVLPYAQVLGISDIWTEKFNGITIEPPQWMTGNVIGDVFVLHTFNTMINRSMQGMSSQMTSRPASSGMNGRGGGFGGGFGGHSGGGFGGGGGRGR